MAHPVPADADDAYRVSLEAGAYLYRAGDAAPEMFLIREGEIELLGRGPGAELRLATLLAGDVLGEVEMLEGSSRRSSARAITACVLIKIDPATLLGLVQRRPPIALHIIRRLGHRLSDALEAPGAGRPDTESARNKSGQPAEAPVVSQPRRAAKQAPADADTAAEGTARLTGGRPGGPRASYALGRTTTIGRTLRNTIAIPVPDVSRSHARIDLTPAGFVLTDLNSQNGTFVNGERIKEQVLKVNDQVRIGDEASFVFLMGAHGEDPGNARR
jgi:hypothetical protein